MRKSREPILTRRIAVSMMAAFLAWLAFWGQYHRVSAEEVLIEDIPHRPQSFNLSCESRSAVDLAAFWRVYVAEDVFLAALPRSDNPHRGFVGDVNAAPGSLPPAGYGVYAEPVADTLRRFGLNAHARYGIGIDGLRAELKRGRPVLVWATYDMSLNATQEWVSADGLTSRIVPYEHTFVAHGYDEDGFWLADAYDGEIKHYTYAAFAPAWQLLDQMAIVAYGPLFSIHEDDSFQAAWCPSPKSRGALCRR